MLAAGNTYPFSSIARKTEYFFRTLQAIDSFMATSGASKNEWAGFQPAHAIAHTFDHHAKKTIFSEISSIQAWTRKSSAN
jgi:hypothetical protein